VEGTLPAALQPKRKNGCLDGGQMNLGCSQSTFRRHVLRKRLQVLVIESYADRRLVTKVHVILCLWY
jgi:hypothetical protein